jgi:hypothetical protein
MRRIGGVVLTVTGFLACPCHLIITLPFLAHCSLERLRAVF